jgi:aminoglycoside phosphotransferase (APT) family kinase protein
MRSTVGGVPTVQDAVDALLPAPHRAAAGAALAGVLAGAPLRGLAPVTGGASGALTYRADTPAGALLLRVETARDPFRDPHRSYPCLRAAAAAGIAPPVHHADPDAGVVVMAYLDQRPLAEHPGGPGGVVAELGGLLARLQATPPFPPLLGDFGALLDRMLALVEEAGVFVQGALRPHREAFVRLRAGYPWGAAVSSHNDVNESNVLFDGRRLWLVDWETAFRNDPLADVAIVANTLADGPGLEDVLLEAWLGRTPEAGVRTRLATMRRLVLLYYGCLMVSVSVGRVSGRALDAPTPDEFRAAVASGALTLADPETLFTLGRMQLAGFLAGEA